MMANAKEGYERILVAIDFSPHADAALKQAIWLARLSAAQIVMAHTLPDLRDVLASAPYPARMDLFYGEGDDFQQAVRRESDTTMRRMIVDLNAVDLDVRCETLLGEPFVEIIHAVQQEGYDIVLAGTRGLAAWERFLVGSTAKRLIRKCPASVWIVKAEHVGRPSVVLVATDLSDVSRKAAAQGLWVAQQANAVFHLLHVIDAKDVPQVGNEESPHRMSPRQEINAAAQQRFDVFLESLRPDRTRIRIHSHLSWGTPWKEVGRMAQHVAADLIVMGTVGRSGIKGLLLGNTAEKVLDTCDCSILTVKPDDFVSPIAPPFWPLHPK